MEALCATTPKEIDEGEFFKSRCKLAGGSLRAGHRANWPAVNTTLPGCFTGAPNENIVQNHLNIALLNVF